MLILCPALVPGFFIIIGKREKQAIGLLFVYRQILTPDFIS
jgi:hypothetical protein